MPVVTTFFGKSLLEAAAIDGHYPWQHASDEDQAAQAREEEDEETGARDRTPPLMVLVPGVLLLAAIAIGLVPGAVPGIATAGAHFIDHAAYIGWVLRGGHAHFAPATTNHVQAYDYLYGAGTTVGALGMATLALFGQPLSDRLATLVTRPLVGALGALRGLQSGHIGDYIAWWTAGAAVLGGASLILLT